MADQPLERGRRIELVRLALAVPLRGNVTVKRFGELVAAEEGRERAYDKSTSGRWEEGAAPGIAAIEAMSRLARREGLLYVSRAWLAFGDEGVVEAKESPAAPAEAPERAGLTETGEVASTEPDSAKQLRGAGVRHQGKPSRGRAGKRR